MSACQASREQSAVVSPACHTVDPCICISTLLSHLQYLTCLPQVPNVVNYVEPDSKTKKPKKNMDIRLYGLWGQGEPVRVQPEVFTPSGKLHTEGSWLSHGPVPLLWVQGSLCGCSQRVCTRLDTGRGRLCPGELSLL